MFKRFFSTQLSVTGAALVLGAASLASRLMGMVRDRVLAHMFGAGDMLDAYYAAFRIPDTIYNLLIVGALSAGFIPVFVKILAKDRDAAWKFTSNMITIASTLLVVVCGALCIATPSLMPFVVPGFSGEKLDLVILFTRIMFLSPILLGISGIISGVLQSLKSFFLYAIAPIFYNIGIIIGATVLVPMIGTPGLAWGVILGAFLHLAIQVPMLVKEGFHYRPTLHFSDPAVKEIGKLMIPRTLGLAANQINLLAVTVLASTLPAGSIAMFNFANNLQYVPVGIIGISFAIAVFPTLAGFVADENLDAFRSHIAGAARQILFFIVPATIIFLLLRAQIVRVVLGSGAFDWEATIITANALAFFAISLSAQCLIPLLARSFYALHDTWTPFVISVCSELISLVLSLMLREQFGVVGFALAFSIASSLQLVLLWVALRHKIHGLQEGLILTSLYKISIAGIGMAVAIQFLKAPLAAIVNMTTFVGIFLQGFIAAVIGLLLYGALCYVFKVEEIQHLQSSLKRRWLKLWGIQGEIQS